jgi:hypothetical protein
MKVVGLEKLSNFHVEQFSFSALKQREILGLQKTP